MFTFNLGDVIISFNLGAMRCNVSFIVMLSVDVSFKLGGVVCVIGDNKGENIGDCWCEGWLCPCPSIGLCWMLYRGGDV